MKTSQNLGQFDYKGESLHLHHTLYASGQNALILCPRETLTQTPENHVLSVCLEKTRAGEVVIQNHDFFAGNLDFLIQHKIIEPPHRYQQSGFVSYPVCILLAPAL